MAAAVASPTPSAFTSARFLDDFKRTADVLESPYSESTVQGTLRDFDGCFQEGTVIWRATSRPKDKLNYRFYLRDRRDTVAIAAKAGYIEANSPMARLATSWSGLFEGDTVQWCDLDPEEGVSKTWVYLRGQRSVDNVLDASEVPDCVRAHRSTFHSLGLKLVHFVAVDHHGGSLNIYFTVPGPITKAQAAAYTNLAGAEPPTDAEFEDMRKFLPSERFVFATTIDYNTGKIKRVAFYAINITMKEIPATANDRLRTFFTQAPSYDKQQARNFAWSYGNGNSKYMKAEASYTGELHDWIKGVHLPAPEKLAKLLDDVRSGMSF